MSQLVDIVIPFLQPHPHTFNLAPFQHLRLHPINPRNLRHLVDFAPQQPQTQRLHDQMLDLIGFHLRLVADSAEGHGSVVRWAAKDQLGQCREGDLLVEEDLVGVEEGIFVEVVGEAVEGGEIAAVEGEEEVTEPGVRVWWFESVEDRVEEQFTKVVDAVGDEGGDGEIVGSSFLFFACQVRDLDAGKV